MDDNEIDRFRRAAALPTLESKRIAEQQVRQLKAQWDANSDNHLAWKNQFERVLQVLVRKLADQLNDIIDELGYAQTIEYEDHSPAGPSVGLMAKLSLRLVKSSSAPLESASPKSLTLEFLLFSDGTVQVSELDNGQMVGSAHSSTAVGNVGDAFVKDAFEKFFRMIARISNRR